MAKLLENQVAIVDSTAAAIWGYCSEEHTMLARKAQALATAKATVSMAKLVAAVKAGDINTAQTIN